MAGIIAKTLTEALQANQNQDLSPYGGGTDLMIEEDCEQHGYIFLHHIKELQQISQDEQYFRIGAGCSFTDVLAHDQTPELLKEAIRLIAAPAIRNFGTIGGNIGNGSAKADSVLIFFVLDAVLRLKNMSGERLVSVKDFYIGRKQLDLKPDELIVEVLLPIENFGAHYYKKIGARVALAISRVDFAGVYRVEEGVIRHLAIAMGAITPVILRHPEIDQQLIGLSLEQARIKKQEIIDAYDKVINPISGRISATYRKTVCMNLLDDFLDTVLNTIV